MTAYDVAILSDLRYPGGTTAAIVAEVRAQAAAGLRTVLIHAPAPNLRHTRPFQPRIVECLRDGLADLAHDDGTEVTAKVLLIRQPRIFTVDLETVPKVRAGHTIVVLGQTPGDYAFAGVRARVESYFGPDVVWAPVTATVRDDVQRADPCAVLPDTDWHEIIDVADWTAGPRGPGTVPVVGRHGRPDPMKWPRDPGELLQAYPESDDVRVRLLGGGEIAVRRLGRRPANWDVVEFGAEAPAEFLRTLDFFVYFHDPGLADGFGRTVLEAMAAGVPVIVGPHFRSAFGEAAVYTGPAGVLDLVRRLHADRSAYDALVARARSFVAERYGGASHLARLASLGVVPRARVPMPRAAVRAPRPTRRVLFVGDDVDRFRAIARRLPSGLEAVVVAGSRGLAAAHAAGLLAEYLPPGALVHRRLRHLIELYGPRAVVVGGLPHDGIMAAVGDCRATRWLWLRPAMWKRGAGAGWASRGDAFDGVLEPGEFAAAGDEGWTTTSRSGVVTVAPITNLPDRPRRRVRGAGTLLATGVGDVSLPGFRTVAPGEAALNEVTVAVARADYATFHELLGARVPSVFVPDPDAFDDQVARARFADAAGAAICATPKTLDGALTRLADPATRSALRRRCHELTFGNGAADAAGWVAGHCRGTAPDRSEMERRCRTRTS